MHEAIRWALYSLSYPPEVALSPTSFALSMDMHTWAPANFTGNPTPIPHLALAAPKSSTVTVGQLSR